MDTVLQKYLPEHAVIPVFELIKANHVHLKVVSERITRHGDYRKHPNGMHQITVNSNLNKYRFLITLIHEMAHLVAFEKFGRNIKPHGIEWKQTFRILMIPFLNTFIFPEKILPLLQKHFRNPSASSDTDALLSMALKQYDSESGSSDKVFVNDLPTGSYFRIYNGRVFKKGALRVKRFECIEIKTGRLYVFKPNVEVEWIR